MKSDRIENEETEKTNTEKYTNDIGERLNSVLPQICHINSSENLSAKYTIMQFLQGVKSLFRLELVC